MHLWNQSRRVNAIDPACFLSNSLVLVLLSIHKESSRKKMEERNRFTRKMDDCLKSIEDNICLPEFLKILEVGVMGWGNA